MISKKFSFLVFYGKECSHFMQNFRRNIALDILPPALAFNQTCPVQLFNVMRHGRGYNSKVFTQFANAFTSPFAYIGSRGITLNQPQKNGQPAWIGQRLKHLGKTRNIYDSIVRHVSNYTKPYLDFQGGLSNFFSFMFFTAISITNSIGYGINGGFVKFKAIADKLL